MYDNYSNFDKNSKAVALGYDKKIDPAPKIIATGQGLVAEQIVAIAEDYGIPVYHNEQLAELLSALQVNQYIPPEIYGVVAEIVAYVYNREEQRRNNKLQP